MPAVRVVGPLRAGRGGPEADSTVQSTMFTLVDALAAPVILGGPILRGPCPENASERVECK